MERETRRQTRVINERLLQQKRRLTELLSSAGVDYKQISAECGYAESTMRRYVNGNQPASDRVFREVEEGIRRIQGRREQVVESYSELINAVRRIKIELEKIETLAVNPKKRKDANRLSYSRTTSVDAKTIGVEDTGEHKAALAAKDNLLASLEKKRRAAGKAKLSKPPRPPVTHSEETNDLPCLNRPRTKPNH